MSCLPDLLSGRTYYRPTDQGFEARLRQRLDEIRRLKSAKLSPSGDHRRNDK
jgi:putative ATPase